jgi:hypothetical protein
MRCLCPSGALSGTRNVHPFDERNLPDECSTIRRILDDDGSSGTC